MENLLVVSPRDKILEDWLSKNSLSQVRIGSINLKNFSVVHFRLFNTSWFEEKTGIVYDQVDFCVMVNDSEVQIISTQKNFFRDRKISLLDPNIKGYVDSYGHLTSWEKLSQFTGSAIRT